MQLTEQEWKKLWAAQRVTTKGFVNKKKKPKKSFEIKEFHTNPTPPEIVMGKFDRACPRCGRKENHVVPFEVHEDAMYCQNCLWSWASDQSLDNEIREEIKARKKLLNGSKDEQCPER